VTGLLGSVDVFEGKHCQLLWLRMLWVGDGRQLQLRS